MSNQETSTVAPSLIRAVAEATQPFGPFLQGPSLHALEVSSSCSLLETSFLVLPPHLFVWKCRNKTRLKRNCPDHTLYNLRVFVDM